MEEGVWANLEGGYRVPFDPRPLLATLRDDPENDRLWSELIEELYHQGDVGEASYAAVPEVVKIGGREDAPSWQLLALVAFVELARTEPQNPSLPEWLQASYWSSIEELSLRCLHTMDKAKGAEQLRGVLCILALWKGLRVYASVLSGYSEDELSEMISK